LLAYQKSKAEENQAKIIFALSEGAKTYTQLLQATGLSRPILAEHLKTLDQKKVKLVPHPETKSYLYALIEKGLTDKDKAYVKLSKIRRTTVAELERAASSKAISDESYLKLFEEKVQTLAVYQLLFSYLVTPDYGKEWIERTYGQEFYGKLKHLLPSERLEALTRIMKARNPETAFLITQWIWKT